MIVCIMPACKSCDIVCNILIIAYQFTILFTKFALPLISDILSHFSILAAQQWEACWNSANLDFRI